MVDRTSRVLLLIEALIFLLPLTFLSVGYTWFLSVLLSDMVGEGKLATQQLLATLIVAIAIQAVAWFEIGRFVAHGRKSLARVSGFWISVLGLASAIVLVSLVSVFLDLFDFTVAGSAFDSIRMVATFGTPALVPFAHFALEYRGARTHDVIDRDDI